MAAFGRGLKRPPLADSRHHLLMRRIALIYRPLPFKIVRRLPMVADGGRVNRSASFRSSLADKISGEFNPSPSQLPP